MVAYCTDADLLLGEIPLPRYMSAAQKVQDAADEIDSRIGHVYQTPIDVSNGSTVSRPARLLFKRINASLASGRILLAIASPEENRNLHAYAWSLVRDSLAALDQIVSGEIPIPGATPSEDAVADDSPALPLISNVDAESNVEAFYDRVGNPNFSYGSVLPRPSADRLLW